MTNQLVDNRCSMSVPVGQEKTYMHACPFFCPSQNAPKQAQNTTWYKLGALSDFLWRFCQTNYTFYLMHYKLEAQHTSEIVTKHANVVKFCFDFYGVYLQENQVNRDTNESTAKPSALGDTDCQVGNILLINNSHIRNRSLLFDSDLTINYDYIYARLLPQRHSSGSQVA